ncbi:aspartate:alanine exchanger family transporter [Kaarinaea lacus]
MEVDVYELLKSNDMLLLFLVIGLGYLLGNIRFGDISVGPTIGVLLAALVFGHYQLTVPSEFGTFGFALFIFSVGLQAGPSFFSAFREDGPRYIALAAVVAASGFAIAYGASLVFQFEDGFDAGLLAGGLTSTPTLAGAQDAIRSGLANIPDGMSAKTAMNNVNVGYALTYIIGTITLIIAVRYMPKLMQLNLEAMARTYAKEKGMLGKRANSTTTADTLPIIRAYQITATGVGKTIAQRRAELNKAAVALRVRRGNQLIDAEPQLVMEEGDVISLLASLSVHQWARDTLGFEEVLDPELLDYRINAHELVVINPRLVGKRLSELELPRNYGCFATELIRAGVALPLTDEVVLLKGDRLQVIGEEARLRELGEYLGYTEEEVEETDLVTFSFGIVVGVLLGMIVFKIAGIAIGLGTAGGLLVAGIGIGYLSSINPTFGRVPAPARYLLREFGLMLLMASIGLNAGTGIVEGLTSVGLAIIFCAALVALVPMAIGYVFGRQVLKLNPVLLLGALTGSMTSTPALSIVSESARSSVPAIGYAGSYTFANVLLTFGGTAMMMI